MRHSNGNFPWQHIPVPGRMFGTTTVGERGQVSIPAEARKVLDIDPGDKFVVFGNKLNGAVMLLKADVFEDFADFFTTKLNKLSGGAENFFNAFIEERDAVTDSDEDGETDDETDANAAGKDSTKAPSDKNSKPKKDAETESTSKQ
jgi:AbrB family looped-hinge helix DNA binding protein